MIFKHRRSIIIGAIISIVLIAIIVAVIVVTTNKDDDDNINKKSSPQASRYMNAGVAADHTLCSKIGKDVLFKGMISLGSQFFSISL